jgi:hypothetical protein
MTKDAVLPGEHPHSDRPNWRPAETVDEYFLNVREGLEKPSIERLTKLLGLNRTRSWRARQMSHVPAGLFGRLLKGDVTGTKQLAQIGLALRRGDGNQPAEIEYCPHCGEIVRVRWLVGTKARKIIRQWVDDGMPDAPQESEVGESSHDDVIFLPDRSNAPDPTISPNKRGQ